MSRAPKDMSKYYYGRVCSKHPELEGLRYTARRTCPQCTVDANKAIYWRRKEQNDQRIGT
jgi:hypothetical protein